MWKDSETDVDYLGFTYILDTLNHIIMNTSLMPSSIGVYGYWGSGKSSLIEMSYQTIIKQENTLCVKFNGWKFEGYDDAKTALMGSIMDSLDDYIKNSQTIGEEIKKSLLQKTKEIFKRIDKLRVARVVGSMMIGITNPALLPLLSGVGKVLEKGKSFLKDGEEQINNNSFTTTRREIDNFQSDFNDLVGKSGLDRIVVYIDELDRCNPETILSTLEAIRLFLFINTTVFVIGADERHVKNAVISKFGSEQKDHLSIGKEYLEKMIQYPIRIPKLDINSMEIYILLLLLNRDLDEEDFNSVFEYISVKRKENVLRFTIEETDINRIIKTKTDITEIISISKNLAYILTNNLDGNPRQVKRFLNTLEIRKHFAHSVEVELNDSIMLKLMILEYFRPTNYSFIKKQYEKNIDQLKKELEIIEESGIKKSELFSAFIEDEWLELWFKLKPQLNAIDLGPYFYFSREGMSAIKSIGDIVPPIVETVLNAAIAGGQINMGIAFRTLTELTNLETSILIDEIVRTESGNKAMSLNSFRLLNEIIIKKPEKYSECVPVFKAINGLDVKESFVFVIRDTIKNIKASLKSDFISICSKWEDENKKLKISESEE